jgi:MarR family transcriptional regulator, organic hydroperoxide resistance regulator
MADIGKLLELVELVGRRMRRQFQPIVEAEGISFAELFVLRKVADLGRCRVTELAEDIGIVPSTLTGITDRLVGKSFLSRTTDPDDRRAVLLEPGRKLAGLMERVRRSRDRHLEGAFRVLPPKELDRIVADLEELLKNFEREDDRHSDER